MKKFLLLSYFINICGICALFYIYHRIGGWSYLRLRIENRGVEATYWHRKNLFDLLNHEKNDIIFLGDSLTEFGEWAEFFSNIHIKNRGIAGDGTEGVLRRLPNIVNNQPSKIFLMIGVNDLLFLKTDAILANYRKIIEQIRTLSPHTKLYVQSILPVNNFVRNTGANNEDILILNQGIQQIAKDFDVPYLDLHTLMLDKDGNLNKNYTLDGTHLNGNAYMIWKNALSNFVL